MGITASDISLIERAIALKTIVNVMELGSQNLYLESSDRERPPFANEFYEGRAMHYMCIDMAGDNSALRLNLAKPIPGTHILFDLVTDFGTAEHVVDTPEHAPAAFHDGHINSVYPTTKPTEEQIAIGFYNCWKNKNDLTKPGGLILSVNPKTGNWPDHGYTYLDLSFYTSLAALGYYKIHHLAEHPAMGNVDSGWNIECILEKMTDEPFLSFEDFNSIKTFRS
jgi:hypothetical protein